MYASYIALKNIPKLYIPETFDFDVFWKEPVF